jgi:Family of unknown function (DUF6289)
MKKTLRKVALAALVAGAAAFAATTAPTEAATSSSCTYYSDASHTTVVGRYGKDCCNNTVAWGVKTQYSECGGCLICYPPPR